MTQGLKSQNQPTAEGQQEVNMAQEYKLFENNCSGCGRSVPTYAYDRSGNVPRVFCSSPCETNFTNEARLGHLKVFVSNRKAINSEQLTQKMSKKDWNNKQYLVEEIPV